jgi:DNA repair exonuclease SbcCD ATPase subunit
MATETDNIRFLKGSQANYNALPLKDVNTFYYVDEKDLYLGEILLSSAEDVAAAVASIELNAAAIKTLQDELDALVDPDGTGGGSISTQINTLREELNAAILANTNAITAEETRAKGIESGLRTDVDKVSEDLSTLSATVSANEEDIEKKVSDLNTTIQENTTAISGLDSRVSAHDGAITLLEETIDPLGEAVEELESQISSLIGEDAEKSVRAIAAEELAAQLIPAEAQESLDTLQEIAAWIQGHPDDVADINQAISALEAADLAQDGKITTLEEAIAAINGDAGILQQAKTYTDTEVGSLRSVVEGNKNTLDGEITELQKAIDAINHEDTGILAQAELSIENAITALGLGTASKKDVEYFENMAATAEANAKAYTNAALTWGEIPAAEIE